MWVCVTCHTGSWNQSPDRRGGGAKAGSTLGHGWSGPHEMVPKGWDGHTSVLVGPVSTTWGEGVSAFHGATPI